MNPPRDVLALSAMEVDLAPIAVGSGITVMWQGKPIFVRHRTRRRSRPREDVPLAQLIDPQADSARVKPDHAQWIVLIGICTHLGCVPLGNKATDPRGEWGGWFCPCHGSQYDTSGRVRHGPAPANLRCRPTRSTPTPRSRSADERKHRRWPASYTTATSSNPVIQWIDTRLPIFTMMQKEYAVFPTPKNFNYFWNFGALGDGDAGDHDRSPASCWR